MREVLIIAYCDNQDRHGEDRVRATLVRTASFGGRQSRLVDLCEECDEIFAAFEKLMQHGTPENRVQPAPKPREPAAVSPLKGRKRPANKSNPGPLAPCPDCGHRVKNDSRPGMGQHVKNRHGKVLADYPEFYPDTPAERVDGRSVRTQQERSQTSPNSGTVDTPDQVDSVA